MLQVMFVCSGDVRLPVFDGQITGARIMYDGRTVHVLEGPRSDLMQAVGLVEKSVRQLVQREIERRDFIRWHAAPVTLNALPPGMADRVFGFLHITPPDELNRADFALKFLADICKTEETRPHSTGRRVTTRIQGRSGKRSWMLV